ncbi:MAG: acyl-CoA synthetase [Gammaproteobacteria bacterium]|nr:acyl-CoA synthetase [Gammaproteobacteria bacterium]
MFPGAMMDTPVAYHDGCYISYSKLLNDVSSLVERLPKCLHQINLCENRYYYLVSFLAALQLDQIVILPPSRAKKDIVDIENEHESVYRLIDAVEDKVESSSYFFEDFLGKKQSDVTSIAFSSETKAVKLYTSGSTGSPVAHVKTWGELYSGALLTGERMRLGELNSFTLLATVPQQHMYGLEASIMLPLVWNGVVSAYKPLMPDDIKRYALELKPPLVFATTPIHISGCTKVKASIPGIRLMISATAPLTQSVAVMAENLFATTLYEIYGSTETGAIATRRSSKEESWTLLPGVSLHEVEGSFSVQLDHYAESVKLHDDIGVIDQQTFRLLGRSTDLIKIAGKRTSLGYLNARLLEIFDVDDGVFYFPDNAGISVQRTCVFVVAPKSGKEGIVCALRDRIDAAFMPREIIFVNKIPRNATGKVSQKSLEDLYQKSC